MELNHISSSPFVSVCMITYNHEAFIAQAIEGALRQTRSFPLEIVLGEDFSTDRTREICLEYKAIYPSLITLLPRDRNVGIYKNFLETHRACRGKYIAMCEGDDYWTDSHKLQKQVDFLEANPDFSACFHDAEVVYLNREKAPHSLIRNNQDVFTFEDVLAKNVSVPTCSLLFRNDQQGFPEDLLLLDWVILLLLAKRGKLKRLDGKMAVYHQHAGGWTNKNWTQKALELVEITRLCRNHFGPEHEEEFDRILAHDLADVCFGYFQDGDVDLFLSYYREIGSFWKYLPDTTRRALLRRKRLSRFPKLAKLFARSANGYREYKLLRRNES